MSRLISLALCAIGAGIILLGPGASTGARGAALVALAGAGALLASRGVARRVIASVMVLSGVALALTGSATAIVAGTTVAIGASIAFVTSGSWPVMGRRYERLAEPDTTDLWAAMDRGEDPTALDGRGADSAAAVEGRAAALDGGTAALDGRGADPAAALDGRAAEAAHGPEPR